MTSTPPIDDYELVERVGEGATSAVWRATRRGAPSIEVAVKLFVRWRSDPRAAADFEHERDALFRLDHPSIPRLLDARHAADGTPYLVLDLVKGERIDRWCDRCVAPLRTRIELFMRACDSVEHAHRNLVIHGDLKPPHVLVTADGAPKLLDFGTARLASSGAVAPAGAMSLAYASPQRLAQAPLAVADDVYSLGVVLFELLTSRLPHDLRGRSIADAERVVAGSRAPRAGAIVDRDLDAIVARALEKEARFRYPSVAALRDDLDRYLRGLPVSARPIGALVRLGRAAARRPWTSSAAALLALAISGVATVAIMERARGEAAAQVSALQRDALLPFRDRKELDELVRDADLLWPARPSMVPALRNWMRRAEGLLARRPRHRARFSEAAIGSEEDRWRRDAIGRLLADLDRLEDADPAIGALTRIRRRIDDAESIRARSVDDFVDEWIDAREAIAASERYDGLDLTPQLGLVPLGPDPSSGLWEFWCLETGEPPVRDATTGRFQITGDTAIVLVLIPGGVSVLGVQMERKDEPRYLPSAMRDEMPLHQVRLDPFFIAKYELTRGQWLRLAGSAADPSFFATDSAGPYGPVTDSHPVDSIPCSEFKRLLMRAGLDLPTEAQWEYAARAGSDSPWWTGETADTLIGSANLADRATARAGFSFPAIDEWGDVDDGFAIHAPVGALNPNPWGLHDTSGNVYEYCADPGCDYVVDSTPRDGDGMNVPHPNVHYEFIVVRGGAFFTSSTFARASFRMMFPPDTFGCGRGARAARSLDP